MPSLAVGTAQMASSVAMVAAVVHQPALQPVATVLPTRPEQRRQAAGGTAAQVQHPQEMAALAQRREVEAVERSEVLQVAEQAVQAGLAR